MSRTEASNSADQGRTRRVRWPTLALGCVLAWSAAALLGLGPRGQALADAAPVSRVIAPAPETLRSEGGNYEAHIAVALAEAAPETPAAPEPSHYRIFLGQIRVPAPYPVSDGQVRELEVPLLMYHYVSPLPAHADAIRRDLTIEPVLFVRHLDRIQELGYQTVTIRSIVQHLHTGAALPEKPIVLTFDDGYVDHYVNVLPALQHRDMVGTFFIVSDFPYSGNSSYMDWGMIREMARAGMEIESHAQMHKTLADRSEAYLRDQAENSLRAFQQELGYRPRIISYPSGKFDAQTIRIYQATGFWAGITTLPGNDHRSDDLFRMHRVRLHGGDDPDRLEWLLSREGDAWLSNLGD